MPPATLTLPQHTAGDTWAGFSFGPVTPAPAYPAASAAVVFRTPAVLGKSVVYTIGTTPGSKGVLTINNASSYTITAPKQNLPLGPGEYVCRLQTVDSQGTKTSYLDMYLTVV